ncbi:hypothetical protein KSX_18420 [Ktedonospora formicarum]|uniref:DUF4241 domain-containing protein n=1 Tax=Ktedonospora formicarum TaxID=2778364 RepID=A0A8J3HTZ0_9CHLR|nr:hypothetical protein KSX_18420 [Ktedonospora formicarum]
MGNTAKWVNANLDEQTGANIIAFYSGWGDGCYGSYFGYDEQEQPICLLTNFDVLNDEE